MDQEDAPISVLFICLGNICRSPMAEAVFKHTVEKHGLQHRFDIIDSAGTAGYHIGELPDSRARRSCDRYNVVMNHRARQVTTEDLVKFDYLLTMDTMNLEDMKELSQELNPSGSVKAVQLFGDYREKGSKLDRIVRDPYYGGVSGFEDNFKQLTGFSETFLRQVLGAKI